MMIEGEELRVVNIRTGARYDVYIGRPSKWGNPYSHLPLRSGAHRFHVPTRERAIECYEEYVRGNSALMDSLFELRNMVLGCHCHPLPCHGDVLVKLVDEVFQ